MSIRRGSSFVLNHRGVVAGIAAVAAAGGAVSEQAFAIRFGTAIADTDHPSVGILRVANDNNSGFGTGVIIENNILPKRSFVLTATHNFTHWAEAVNATSFHPKGRTVAAVDASAWTLHPKYDSSAEGMTEAFDIGVVRFNTEIAGITPSALFRQALAEGDTLTAVGFGQPQDTSNFPNNIVKRKGDFRIDAINATKIESRSPNPNPPPEGFQRLPVIGTGDSGGPWFKGTDHKVAAITHSVDTDFNSNPTRSFATRITPYLDFIDSFTQRSVFWDNLRIVAAQPLLRAGNSEIALNDVFSGAYTGGLSEGWARTAVSNYPNPSGGNVDVPLNMDSRPYEGLGHNNGDVPEETVAKGQGLFPTGATPFIIKRTFQNISWTEGWIPRFEIDQKWNSLELGARVGVQIGDGAIAWGDFFRSAGDSLDSWITRTMDISTLTQNGSLSVYLATAVPTPGPAALLAVAGLLISRRRR